MNFKKVLFVDQYNKVGGGQSVLIDLVNTFISLGSKVTVALPQGGYVETKVKEASFVYLPALLLSNGKKNVNDYFKLAYHYFSALSISKQFKSHDVIYVNGSRYFYLMYLLSFFTNKLFIYHIHLDFDTGIKKLISRIIRKNNTHKLVFTSQYVLDKYTDYDKESVQSNKLVVINPGLSEKFSELPFVDRFHTATDQSLNFVSFGRITPEKGFDVFVTLASHFLNHNFYVVGEPEFDTVQYFQSLKDRATSNVHFLGKSHDLPALIQQYNIHVAVIPSMWEEPFGIVAIESMACSCLTFISNRGGLLDISKVTGAIVFETVDQLINKVQSTLSLPKEQLRDLVEKQYSSTIRTYSITRFSQQISDSL